MQLREWDAGPTAWRFGPTFSMQDFISPTLCIVDTHWARYMESGSKDQKITQNVTCIIKVSSLLYSIFSIIPCAYFQLCCLQWQSAKWTTLKLQEEELNERGSPIYWRVVDRTADTLDPEPGVGLRWGPPGPVPDALHKAWEAEPWGGRVGAACGGCLAAWPGFLAPELSGHQLKSMLTSKSQRWQIDLRCLRCGFTSLHRAVRSQLWHRPIYFIFKYFFFLSEYTLCNSVHGLWQKWQDGIPGVLLLLSPDACLNGAKKVRERLCLLVFQVHKK